MVMPQYNYLGDVILQHDIFSIALHVFFMTASASAAGRDPVWKLIMFYCSEVHLFQTCNVEM